MGDPVAELVNILSPKSGLSRGTVVSVSSNGIVVSTASGPITLPFSAGYRTGDTVLLNPDNTLRGRSPSTVGVPIYVV